MTRKKKILKIIKWSKEDLSILSDVYTKIEISIEEMMMIFPGRTRNAIWLKANRIGIKRPNLIEILSQRGETDKIKCKVITPIHDPYTDY